MRLQESRLTMRACIAARATPRGGAAAAFVRSRRRETRVPDRDGPTFDRDGVEAARVYQVLHVGRDPLGVAFESVFFFPLGFPRPKLRKLTLSWLL